MYPDRDTSRNVPRSGFITARDQSMVEGGVIEGGKNNQWSVPAILLFTKNAGYKNEKCLKIKDFMCILQSKLKKRALFFTFTRRFENLRKVPSFLKKSRIFLGFEFDIK